MFTGRSPVALVMAATTVPALDNVTSSAAMAWEATRLADPSRHALAAMVLRHRVLPRDPLDPADPDQARGRSRGVFG